MLWELRLRQPRGIDDVVIETDLDTEAEARRVADAYIASLASPAMRFIYVRRMIVARSQDHPRTGEAKEEQGKEKSSKVTKPLAPTASTEAVSGRIGA